jgi:hypothetical protein
MRRQCCRCGRGATGSARHRPLKPNPCGWSQFPPSPRPLPHAMGEGERFGSRKQSHCSGSPKVGRKRLPLLGESAGVRGIASFELAWIGLKAGGFVAARRMYQCRSAAFTPLQRSALPQA